MDIEMSKLEDSKLKVQFRRLKTKDSKLNSQSQIIEVGFSNSNFQIRILKLKLLITNPPSNLNLQIQMFKLGSLIKTKYSGAVLSWTDRPGRSIYRQLMDNTKWLMLVGCPRQLANTKWLLLVRYSWANSLIHLYDEQHAVISYP